MDFVKDWIPTIKDIVVTASAGIGAFVALSGLNRWKKESAAKIDADLWKGEYELARRLLKSSYQIRESIKRVRSPLMTGAEMPLPPENHPANESPEHRQWFGVCEAYKNRWQTLEEAQIELDTALLESEVLWGKETRNSFSPLKQDINLLFRKLKHHLHSQNPDNNPYDRVAPKEKREFDEIIYGDSTDEFGKQVEESVR